MVGHQAAMLSCLLLSTACSETESRDSVDDATVAAICPGTDGSATDSAVESDVAQLTDAGPMMSGDQGAPSADAASPTATRAPSKNATVARQVPMQHRLKSPMVRWSCLRRTPVFPWMPARPGVAPLPELDAEPVMELDAAPVIELDAAWRPTLSKPAQRAKFAALRMVQPAWCVIRIIKPLSASRVTSMNSVRTASARCSVVRPVNSRATAI